MSLHAVVDVRVSSAYLTAVFTPKKNRSDAEYPSARPSHSPTLPEYEATSAGITVNDPVGRCWRCRQTLLTCVHIDDGVHTRATITQGYTSRLQTRRCGATRLGLHDVGSARGVGIAHGVHGMYDIHGMYAVVPRSS